MKKSNASIVFFLIQTLGQNMGLGEKTRHGRYESGLHQFFKKWNTTKESIAGYCRTYLLQLALWKIRLGGDNIDVPSEGDEAKTAANVLSFLNI